MAYYKRFDDEKFRKFPVFALWFRRYAPFDEFGVFPYRFDGDHRTTPSTSPDASSRTYGCVFFNRLEVLYGFSGAGFSRFVGITGTHWTPGGSGEAVGLANVALHIAERNGHDTIRFTASTRGAMPLVPGSPDIVTSVQATAVFNNPRVLMASVVSTGSVFPNLEVFLRSGSHAAMFIDGRTSGGQDSGPLQLIDSDQQSNDLGGCSQLLQLNDNGQLARDYNSPFKQHYGRPRPDFPPR